MCFTWGGVLWGTGGEKHGDDRGSIECTQMVFVCSPMNSNWALDCWMRVPIVSSSCIATQILQNKTSAKLAARQIVNWPSVTTKWLSFDTNIPNPPPQHPFASPTQLSKVLMAHLSMCGLTVCNTRPTSHPPPEPPTAAVAISGGHFACFIVSFWNLLPFTCGPSKS